MRCIAVFIVLGLGGCLTPSIPIPPPDPARMNFNVETLGGSTAATFTYPPDTNYVDTIAYVYNRDLGIGVIQNAKPDGSVGPTAPVTAALGAQIVVSFQRADQTVSTCIRLRNGQQSSTDYCD